MAWKKQETANIWLPESEGEELTGTVTKVEDGTYGLQYTIKKEDGEETRTPSHKVLQNRMANAKEGTKVKIVFVKEEAPAVRGNNPTKIYEVYFDE